jgi:hypothetical protein
LGRPAGYQWEPLGLDVDPVPGVPAAIIEESGHLSSVATMINDQITALNKIANSGDAILEGKYADTLRSSASSLSGDLGKILGRYQKVAAALNAYVPELEQAQSMSLTALDQATGPAGQLSNLNSQTLPSGPKLTQAQQQQISDHKTAVSNAQAALGEATALLAKATGQRDSAASDCANTINNASNDGMRDHWYESFGDWISAHWVSLLKTICTILEILGAILAIIAFILAQFVPGLDVLIDALVLAAFMATLAATLGRFVLAVTHNGSWWDFALDAFACLTFGAGRMMGAGLEALADSSEDAARGIIEGQRALAIMKGELQLSKVADMFSDQQLLRISTQYMAKVEELYPDLAKAPESVSRLRLLLNIGGWGNDASNWARIVSVAERFPGTVADYSGGGALLVRLMGITTGVAGLSGIAGTIAGGIQLGTNTHHYWFNWIPNGWLYKWYDTHLEQPTGGS